MRLAFSGCSSLCTGSSAASLCRPAAPIPTAGHCTPRHHVSTGYSAARSRTARSGVQLRASLADAPAVDTTTSPEAYVLRNGTVDYYAVLQVDDDADAADIKYAYRNIAKVCHPDMAGDKGHNMCILLNEAYAVLSSPHARAAYNAELEQALADDADGYTGEILSKWMPTVNAKMAKHENPLESRGVFVDELTCIGCKNCVWCASATFRMEELHGRSRVYAQWLDTEDSIQQAIDSCPVDCIHWVYKDQLAALEYVCQIKLGRTDIAAMMSNPGLATDVFGATEMFLKERKKLEQKRKTAQSKQSPMQEAVRRAAAEEMARKQSGWFGQMSYRMGEGLKDMAGVYESSVSSSSSSSFDRKDGARVGFRKRPKPQEVVYAEQEYTDNMGGTIPLELSLVMSRDEGDW